MYRDKYGRFIRTANQCQPVQQAGGYRRFVERLVRERWGLTPRWEAHNTVQAEVADGVWRA